MRSYDYAHREGVYDITWEEFVALSRTLAEGLDRIGVDCVVGIARAGLFPATAVACALRCELYPVRLTRRIDDEVRFATPVWRFSVPAEVAGRAVAVVDEIADTGETLALAAESVRTAGARQVATACLVNHGWAKPAPDLAALVTSAFVIFPWDRRVLIDGTWQPHPEIARGLAAQRRATKS
jgi:hypoxanthine phosphoribosyltransferase